jgi:hypothetical protein
MTNIDDKAVVCPSCCRDLIFYVPLSERIDQLDRKLSEFVASVQSAKVEVVRPISRREARISAISHAIKLLIIYSLQWWLVSLLVKESVVLEAFTYWLYSIVAAFYGLWSSFQYPRARARYFIVLGVLLGLIDVLLRGTLYKWTWTESPLFMISDIFWFWTGFVSGRRLWRWANASDLNPSREQTVGELILSLPAQSHEPSRSDRSRNIKEYLTIGVPLIGSIVTTVLSALLAKGK